MTNLHQGIARPETCSMSHIPVKVPSFVDQMVHSSPPGLVSEMVLNPWTLLQ